MSPGRALVVASLGIVLGSIAVGSALTLRQVGRALSGIEDAAPSIRRTATHVRPGTAQQYHLHLRAIGLTEEETKPLVLAMLESAATRDLKPRPHRYWRDERTVAIRAALERLEAERPVRARLVEIYGPAAKRDEAFERVFRPLAERLDFLSSEQQIRLLESRLMHMRDSAENADPSGGALLLARYDTRSAGTARRAPGAAEDFSFGLDATLGPQLRFEVALRESALAEQLRHCGVELDEAEFRETYRVLEALAEEPGAEAYRRARGELRTLLGSDRFDRLWASRDPAFRVVEPMLRSHRIVEETIYAAYAVMSRTEDELARAAEINAHDPARAIELARGAAAREEAQLADLVGPELAKQVLTARAQAFLERAGAH